MSNGFTLTDLADTEILQQIQDSFSSYTGIASVITDENGTPVTRESGFTEFCCELTRKTEEGLRRCEECDKMGAIMSHEAGKPAVYNCHAGLIDFAFPIILEDRVIGSVVGGQVRPGEIDEEQFRHTAEELGIDPDRYVAAAYKTYRLSKEEVEKAAQFLAELAKAVSNMVYNNWKTLTDSRKMERAARSQSAFVTGLSEELRVSMRGWLNSFRRTSDKCRTDEELSAEIDELLSKGQEVYSVINGAVDYMRLTEGNADFSEGEYDIRKLVESTVGSLVPQAEMFGVTLSCYLDPDLPETFIGSSSRIGQVLNKLLLNGIRFTGDGGKIIVTVSGVKALYSTDLKIIISDTGSGMSRENFDKLSEIFMRGSADVFSENEEYKHMDLPLVFVLLRQMSARIELEKGKNGETAFIITIPQLVSEKKAQ